MHLEELERGVSSDVLSGAERSLLSAVDTPNSHLRVVLKTAKLRDIKIIQLPHEIKDVGMYIHLDSTNNSRVFLIFSKYFGS